MRGRICIAAAAILWSFGGVLIKIITAQLGVSAEAMACLRSAAAGLALAWALPMLRGSLRGRMALAALFFAPLVGTFVRSTTLTSAANAILLQYFYPLLVAIGARLWYAETIDRRTLAALALGTAGVVTIIAGSWEAAHLEGVGLGLISAVLFAGFVLVQRGLREADPMALSSLYNLIAAAAILPFAWPKLGGISGTALALIAFTGLVQLGLPYFLFMKGLKSVPAAEAALMTLLEPILNPLWVWLLYGEQPGLWTLLGGAAILLALVIRLSNLSKGNGAEPSRS